MSIGIIVIIWFFSAVIPLQLFKQTWIGFGEDTTKSKSNETTRQGGRVTSTKETHTISDQSAKTLWDLLGLLSTLAIPVVLFQFQYQEQKRAEQRNETEQEIAANNLREEALRDYIDKMADLLIDKKLKILIADFSNEKALKILLEQSKGTSPQDNPMLDAVLDVARARTLSILRRLDGDGERKGSVVRFLIDAELVKELELLVAADLSNADLKGTDL